MSVNSLKRPGAQLESYKIKEVKNHAGRGLGPYVDFKHVYEVFKHFDTDEKLTVMTKNISRKRASFIGDSPDLFEVFNKRTIVKETTKTHISVKVEMPETDGEGIRIRRVDCESPDQKLGEASTTFFMSVESGNLSSKNLYSLLGCPDIILRIVSDFPKPDGINTFKYEWEVYGDPDDYVTREMLLGDELVNSGAPLEEGALTRGHVELGGMGNAYALYRFPVTRMGFEKKVTDKAWQLGTFLMMKNSDKAKCENKDYAYSRLSFSDIDTSFHFASEAAMERWMIAGKSPSRKHVLRFTDKTTHRPIETGPSFLDYLRGSGAEYYNYYSFRINQIMDRIQRDLNKNDDPNKGGIVVDVITGTPGFTQLIHPELQRLDPGCNGCDGIYEKEDPLVPGGVQQYALKSRRYRSIYLDPYGKLKFHISTMLDKGVLSGNKLFKGWPYSAYWMIVMISQARGTMEKNTAVQIWVNKQMEQRGYLVGSWTPEGGLLNSTPGRWRSGGNLGNTYKIINEMTRTIFIENFNDVCILYPNFK